MATNRLLNGLQQNANWGYTENGGVKHNTTGSAVYDMFALGAAYRTRSEEDCILLFKNALAEDEALAMKCLFYIGDCRGGAGERRFFRVCYHWLANNKPGAAKRNLQYIPEYRRWDDLYELVGTKLEEDAFAFMKHQLALDIAALGTKNGAVSLLAKWLKSENTSSAASRALGTKTRKYLGLTSRQYRKTLSKLRERINVLERLMSANRWDAIEFDKIPSRAGFIYRNAFARHDLERMKAEEKVVSYEAFIKDTSTKANASVLNPVDIAEKVFSHYATDIERAAYEKYWQNLKDYYHGREESGIAVVDVSGSMRGRPMNAAVSMGAYIAERGKGPFTNHFITFSGNPKLVKFEGVDIYDKFHRAASAEWGMNTNIEATFDLLLNVALQNKCTQDEIPTTIYIFSDMEFDSCATMGPISTDWYGRRNFSITSAETATLFEKMKVKWANYGYKLPRVIFWNLNARHENIPAIGEGFSFVSGFSMNMVETILSGEDGYTLMMAKLDTERYKAIR